MKKRFLRIMAVVLMIALLLPNVAFAATGKVSTTNVTNLYDAYNSTKKTWNELKTAKHRLSSSFPAYCLQHKATVPKNDSYNLTDVLDNYSKKVRTGLEIIVTHGYPFNKNGLSTVQAEYATANAIRFWLSECGDSQFYAMTNLGSFSNSQLRSLAAAGTITKKIRVRDESYIPALQFSIELLILARAQVLMEHAVEVNPTFLDLENSGGTFSGETIVTTVNLNGGYKIDQSELPAGSTITGYTGKDGDVLTISIPASEETANKDYTLWFTGYDDRVRGNVQAFNHNTDQSYQRILCVRSGASWYEECALSALTIVTGPYESPKPDLTITSLTPDSSSYETGETMSVTATIKNQGTAASSACSISLSGSGITTQTKSLPALAVGGTTTVTFTPTAPTTAQTLTLTAFADCYSAIEESDESNNTASTTISVEAPKYPDLTITSLTPGLSTYQTGTTMSITATVKNQGEAASGACYISLSGSGITTLAKSLPALAVGASTTVTFTPTAPSTAQTLTLTAFADAYSAVTESNESNNTRSTTVSVVAPTYPDLTITALTPGSSTYETGETMRFTATVKNQGKASAGASSISLSGGGISTYVQTVPALAAGASTTISFTPTAPSTEQPLSVTAFVDCNDVVEESNESNNKASASVEIVAPPAPDLVVTSVYSSQYTYSAGDAITICAIIENQGNADAGTFIARFTPEGLSEQTRTAYGITAGERVIIQWTFTAPTLSQTENRSMTVMADSTQIIDESNENNNTGSTTITILGEKPDLAVKSVTASAQQYSPGDTVTITVRVTNEGKVSCPASTLRLSGEGMTTQNKSIPQLAPGSSTDVSFQFTAPYIEGEKTYAIQAHADPNDQIAEANENNNTGSGSFTVYNPLPDLTVSHIIPNKTEYASGESGTIVVTVKNQGEAAVEETTLKLNIGYFWERTVQIGPIPVGGTTQTQFNFTNSAYEEYQTVNITATIDPEDNISESNENNNTLSTTIGVKPKLPDVGIIGSNATNWYAGMDVVVTATIQNYADEDYPSVAVRLNLGSRQYEESIVLPANGSNLAVFRVTLPNAPGTATLDFTVDPYNVLEEENEGNNGYARTIQIVEVPEGVVFDPDAAELENRYKSNGVPSVPSTSDSDYHTWQEVRLEGGSYVTKAYWAQLNTALTVQPDPRIAYVDAPRQMESGFGVEVKLTTQISTNYDHPEKLVGAQMAWVYAPETGYGQISQWAGVFDALETYSGSPGNATAHWQLKVNPWSESSSRLHYTPLWFPDGVYTLLNQSFYAWTPAGHLYKFDIGSVDILGDMYDRVTAIQGR